MVPMPEFNTAPSAFDSPQEWYDLRDLAHSHDPLPLARMNPLIRAAALGIHRLWREGGTLADAHPLTWRFVRQGHHLRLHPPARGFESQSAPLTIDRLIHTLAHWRAELTGFVPEFAMRRFLACLLRHEPVGPGRTNVLAREIDDRANRLRPGILQNRLHRYQSRTDNADTAHAFARLAADLRLPLLPHPLPTQGVIPAATWLRHALLAGHAWTGITTLWEQTAHQLDDLGLTLTNGPILEKLFVVTAEQEEPLRPIALDPATLVIRRDRWWWPTPRLSDRLDAALQSLLRTAGRSA